uniref:Ig-like domain-containing protein n=1 Tax=Podarcis muralis TaxID=64176 RepID=A0A670KGW6_PODMU
MQLPSYIFDISPHVFPPTDCFTAFIQKNTEEIATEGRSTTITCFYDMEYRFDNKYWCRGSSRTSCDILGETNKFVKWNYKSRLTLLDNRKGVFWVTMHQLTEDDSGTYWCGIERPFADIMTSVKLKVNKGKVSYESHHHLYCYNANRNKVLVASSDGVSQPRKYSNSIRDCIELPSSLCTYSAILYKQSSPVLIHTANNKVSHT